MHKKREVSFTVTLCDIVPILKTDFCPIKETVTSKASPRLSWLASIPLTVVPSWTIFSNFVDYREKIT